MIGSSTSKRIYVKSKRSKPSSSSSKAGASKRARLDGVTAPMPPAYMMRAAMGSIEAWQQKAVGLIEKLYSQSGRSTVAIECGAVLTEYSQVKANSVDYINKCIEAVDKASSPMTAGAEEKVLIAMEEAKRGKVGRQKVRLTERRRAPPDTSLT